MRLIYSILIALFSIIVFLSAKWLINTEAHPHTFPAYSNSRPDTSSFSYLNDEASTIGERQGEYCVIKSTGRYTDGNTIDFYVQCRWGKIPIKNDSLLLQHFKIKISDSTFVGATLRIVKPVEHLSDNAIEKFTSENFFKSEIGADNYVSSHKETIDNKKAGVVIYKEMDSSHIFHSAIESYIFYKDFVLICTYYSQAATEVIAKNTFDSNERDFYDLIRKTHVHK